MSQPQKIHGHHAPAPRLTPLGAVLIALAIAVPGGSLIGLASWLLS